MDEENIWVTGFCGPSYRDSTVYIIVHWTYNSRESSESNHSYWKLNVYAITVLRALAYYLNTLNNQCMFTAVFTHTKMSTNYGTET